MSLMKRELVTLLIFISSLNFSLVTQAQEENSDAIYLKLTREYILNPDGSMEYRYIKKQKLLTYRSFHNLYGETFVVTNPAAQKLTIHEAYTLMADGRKIPVPANAFNEVLPGFAANAPDYNGLREMVITHTGLERNAIICLDYRITTAAGAFPALMGNEVLAESEPVRELEIIVKVPLNQKLSYKVIHTDLAPEKSVDGKFQVYTWRQKNVPPFSPEENQPGGLEQYPRLLFSTATDRESVYSFLTGQPAFRFQLSEALKSSFSNVPAKTDDEPALILELQDKVVNDLRRYPLPLKTALYRCRTPEQVWNSNGGTVIEKAVLLATLLQSAGIEAFPVAITRSSISDDEIGNFDEIEDFAVKVHCNGLNDPVLSVTSINPVSLDVSMAGRSFIPLLAGKTLPVATSGDPQGKVTFEGTCIVSSDPRLTGSAALRLEGYACPVNAMVSDKNKVRNTLTGSIKGKDFKEITRSETGERWISQTFTIESDHPFRKDTNFFYFTLPGNSGGIDGWGIKALSLQRSKSFEIPALAEENYRLNITLPVTLNLFTPQKKFTVKNPAGSFTWEVVEEKGRVTVIRQVRFKERIITPENYGSFKVLMDYWNNPRYRELIFREVK